MSIITENEVVPKLRFKEFSENWIQLTFNEISKEFSYGTGSAATKYDGENKYLRITDIDDETRMFKPKPLTSPNCIIEDKYKLKEDDIVFARTGASVGKSYLYNNCDGNLIYAGFLIKMSVNSADSSFIFYETLREKYYKWVSVCSVRSGQPGLNAEELKSYKLYLPNLIEQKKIALFISAVDEKLQQLSKKKELLEEYKKGIMQKIFSQEIKFKDDNGNEYPDWEESNLGKVAQITTGNSNRSDSESFGEFVFFDRSIDVRMSSTYLLDTEAIIVAGEGSDFIPRYFKGKFGLHQRTYAVYDFVDSYGKFLFYWIYYFRYFFLKTSVGSTVPSLRMNSFIKFPLSLPCKNEQFKISQFLSSIDSQIESLETQIDKSKTWKKGLLQKMFV